MHFFVGKSETTINFIIPANDSILYPNASEGLFIAKYWGFPFPQVCWLDNHGKKIPWNSSKSAEKFETFLDENENLTILKIKDPNYNDCGNYTLRAENIFVRRQETFRLLMIGIQKNIKNYE